jgi:hypothetical protein
METESSLPHSQVAATCPYPEPDLSSPHPHILLPEDPSQYYPLVYAWVPQIVIMRFVVDTCAEFTTISFQSSVFRIFHTN